MGYATITFATLAACVLASCNNSGGPPENLADADARPMVMTTFYPTAYLARRIVGERVAVTNPLPPDADPIFFQPSDDDLLAYQSADLIIINGGEFEKWVANAALPRSRVIDTCVDLDGPFLTFETVTHSHGPGGAHTHEGTDGHTWLDPINAISQTGTILGALIERYPEHAELFRTNSAALIHDLEDLDKRWSDLAPRLRGLALLASHPAYNYLARRYQLQITNIALDPDTELDGDAIAAIDAAAQNGVSDGVAVLLWESEPLASSVATLREELGVRSVLFSPVESLDPAQRASGEDFVSIMNANLDRLESVTR